MKMRLRLCMLFANVFLLLLLLYVRLEGQSMFVKLQHLQDVSTQKQYDYHVLMVEYEKKMSLVPKQVMQKGFHVPHG